jgi:hypothetical protein
MIRTPQFDTLEEIAISLLYLGVAFEYTPKQISIIDDNFTVFEYASEDNQGNIRFYNLELTELEKKDVRNEVSMRLLKPKQ